MPAALDVPRCKLCNYSMTFFFQVSFPNGHPWQGYSIAVFSCTHCKSDDYPIPEMPPGNPAGMRIPDGFLDSYQKNFRILAFPSEHGKARPECTSSIRYRRWTLEVADDPFAPGNKLGGFPNWILYDETPESYEDMPMVFLMQIAENYEFELLKDSGCRTSLEESLQSMFEPHVKRKLFLGNQCYFFGTASPEKGLVYVITQVDR